MPAGPRLTSGRPYRKEEDSFTFTTRNTASPRHSRCCGSPEPPWRGCAERPKMACRATRSLQAIGISTTSGAILRSLRSCASRRTNGSVGGRRSEPRGVEAIRPDASPVAMENHVVALVTTSRALSSSEALCPSDKRSEEHTSELQSRQYLVCRLLLEK